MTTAAERLNNAIVKLDWVTPAQPKGVKLAVSSLASHWVAFWSSAERKALPPAALAPKLARYAAWYARAWALVAPDVRAQCPNPRDLDVGFLAAVEDQLRAIAEGAQAVIAQGGDLNTYLKEKARGLRDELKAYHDMVRDDILSIGALAVAGLFAYAYFVRSR